MRATTATILLTLLAGCSGHVGPSPDADQRRLPPETISLGVGESRTIGALEIRFAGVVEDSRCPSDVTCVWQGNGIVELTLSTAGAPDETVFLGTDFEPRAAVRHGLRVRLVALAPHPVSTTVIQPDAYVAELRVSGIDVE